MASWIFIVFNLMIFAIACFISYFGAHPQHREYHKARDRYRRELKEFERIYEEAKKSPAGSPRPASFLRKRSLLAFFILRAMKFENVLFSKLQSHEGLGATARLPEIDLINTRDMRNDIKPLIVR